LKPPGFNPRAYEVKTRFQAFAFKCNFVPLHNGIAKMFAAADSAQDLMKYLEPLLLEAAEIAKVGRYKFCLRGRL
jgi:hypothetical protein